MVSRSRPVFAIVVALIAMVVGAVYFAAERTSGDDGSITRFASAIPKPDEATLSWVAQPAF